MQPDADLFPISFLALASVGKDLITHTQFLLQYILKTQKAEWLSLAKAVTALICPKSQFTYHPCFSIFFSCHNILNS